MEFLIGLILSTFGIAALFYSFGAISAVVYPIIWWGIIFIIDVINFWRWKKSLIHGYTKQFFLLMVPLSTLFWLYYEFVNIAYPQWIYIGIISDISVRVILSVVSFGTVIPIIVEIFWFLNGPFQVLPFSDFNLAVIKKYRPSLIIFGFVFSTLPFYSGYFYLNQLMWLGPFLVFLPFVAGSSESENKDFWWLAVATGLASGLLWEFLNFWAGGKWQYIILPNAPHIFEMPIYGYIGFVPFAFSTVALYLLAKKYFPASFTTGAVVYALAIITSYVFVIIL